jgi:hypothetical protein
MIRWFVDKRVGMAESLDRQRNSLIHKAFGKSCIDFLNRVSQVRFLPRALWSAGGRTVGTFRALFGLDGSADEPRRARRIVLSSILAEGAIRSSVSTPVS